MWEPTWASLYTISLENFVSTDKYCLLLGFQQRQISILRQVSTDRQHCCSTESWVVLENFLFVCLFPPVQTTLISMYLCMCTFLCAQMYEISTLQPPQAALRWYDPVLLPAPTSQPPALQKSDLEGAVGAVCNGEDVSPGKMYGKSKPTCLCGSFVTKAVSCKDTFVSFWCGASLTQCSAQANLLHFVLVHKTWGSAVWPVPCIHVSDNEVHELAHMSHCW